MRVFLNGSDCLSSSLMVTVLYCNILTARIRRMGEGNVFSLFTSGGVPVSHNALQHFPECHGAARGVPVSHNALQHFPECHGAAGGIPCQVQPGGRYPGRGGVPWPGGYTGRGGTLVGGYPGGGVPCLGGYPVRGGVPCPGGVPS